MEYYMFCVSKRGLSWVRNSGFGRSGGLLAVWPWEGDSGSPSLFRDAGRWKQNVPQLQSLQARGKMDGGRLKLLGFTVWLFS